MLEVSSPRGVLRQGDMLLVPVDALPAGAGSTELDRVGPRHVLAEGEATGHAHVLAGSEVRLLRLRPPRPRWGQPRPLRTYAVVAAAGATMRHEEHLPIAVPAGAYEVRRQREYRPQRPVWVTD